MLINTRILDAESELDINTAASMINDGLVVAIPTETVYGLAADAQNADAVKKIFSIKNRPTNHPLIVHIASVEKLSQWARDIPPVASVIAQNFWPGPMTILLKKHEAVNDVVTGGLDTIALRVPNNKAMLSILNLLDTGLAAPSANPHKRISPTTAEHVLSGLSGKIDGVIDGGPCQVGVESTIIDLTQSQIRILRHGPISKEMIEKVLNVSIDAPLSTHIHVPGNMKSHYQPYTKTRLLTLDEIKHLLSLESNLSKSYGLIHYSELDSDHKYTKAIRLSSIKAEYTKCIYQALHELDSIKADQILIEMPPKEDSWSDILDRLTKACHVE